MIEPSLSRVKERFACFCQQNPRGNRLVVPLHAAMLDDQLTPVLAYRRLVAPDARTAPSFLFESVEGGERQARFSILSAQPAVEVTAVGHRVRVVDHRNATDHTTHEADPLLIPQRLTESLRFARELGPNFRIAAAGEGTSSAASSGCFLGGWAGFASYDSVRFGEPDKLPFASAPHDDRYLPDLALAYYDSVVVFDHVRKLVHTVVLVEFDHAASDAEIDETYAAGLRRLRARVGELNDQRRQLASPEVSEGGGVGVGMGDVVGSAGAAGKVAAQHSNVTRQEHAKMVARAKEYIAAGDVFQVVLGQRFERASPVDPFDVYRCLRAVNPSPYMAYLQTPGCILIASSPEILCRVRAQTREANGTDGSLRRVVTNRPLAGTRKRGMTPDEDRSLEAELLADPKERAEHIMLVDLGRNDVGKVAKPGSVHLDAVMTIERYSHVMHISSTVTGELREELSAWDVLRAALPVGTISGAPKVRAMQIIDELEPIRRGPYGGGLGHIGLDGDMDIALTLRTMVVPTCSDSAGSPGLHPGTWMYHLQAAGGIVADSDADAEYEETVNKAAAMARAINAAEAAFGTSNERGV